jgi:hypothetical protein
LTRRLVVWAGAVLAVVVSVALIAVAVDVLHWDSQVAEQDVRFRAVPDRATYSAPSGLVPFGLAETLLGAGDDLTFRRQLQRYVRVRPGAVFDAIEYEQRRGELQIELARLSRVDPDPRRRSRAANMLGVLALDPSVPPGAQDEYSKVVLGAIDSFRYAVELDPSNAEAKRNLELALRIPGTSTLPPNAPSGTGDVGKTAGLGETGTGY